MRLIDADALENLLENAIQIQETMSKALGIENEEAVQMELKAYRDILNGVKEQPTIGNDPIKPEWNQGKPYCGKCGRMIWPRKHDDEFERNFCSYCGRKVDWNEKAGD